MYKSVIYFSKKINISLSVCKKYKTTCFKQQVKKHLRKHFLNYWTSKREGGLNSGKTWYLFFKSRKFYNGNKNNTGQRIPLERNKKTCLLCNQNCVEDESHFLTECPLYKEERNSFFHYVSILNKNFILLTKKDKFIWLMSNEDKIIITKLSEFLINAFKKRQNTLRSKWPVNYLYKSWYYLYICINYLYDYILCAHCSYVLTYWCTFARLLQVHVCVCTIFICWIYYLGISI